MAVLQGKEARQAIARANRRARRARLAAVSAPRPEPPLGEACRGQAHEAPADMRLSHLFRRTADRLLAG